MTLIMDKNSIFKAIVVMFLLLILMNSCNTYTVPIKGIMERDPIGQE